MTPQTKSLFTLAGMLCASLALFAGISVAVQNSASNQPSGVIEASVVH
jgi:hypothetical protein